MKKIKKILALAMAMVMALGMSVTAFAAQNSDPVMPTASDKTTAKVLNVEPGAEVTAYHIVEAKYDESGEGFTGYQVVAKGKDDVAVTININDPENPTPAEVEAIATDAGLLGNLVSVGMDEVEGEAGTYTAELNAGYWLVLIKGAADTVYNPMLVGVYYSESGTDNTMSSDDLDVTKGWHLTSEPAYAKSTKPEITKEITDEKKDAAVGSDVGFKITTAIPSYGAEYKNAVVEIADTLSEGLSFNAESLKVTVGGTEITENKEAVYSVSTTDEAGEAISGFVLKFTEAFILGDGNGQEVIVEYTAKLTDAGMGMNFDPNTNTAKMTYTNDPHTNETADTEEKTTYTYTFGIDADLYGESKETWNKITEEILKTGEAHEVKLENGETITTTRLGGAEFTLSGEDGFSKTETSDELGRLKFRGLETGTYTLKETKAPDGYALSTESLTVVIAADYNTDGTLKWYSITINGQESKYTATYGTNGEVINIASGSTKTIEGDTVTTTVSNTTGFVNSKIATLPSTGGIGTTIFTIGGCAIMILAAALYFVSRRKSAK